MKRFFVLVLAISFVGVSVFGQDAPVTPKDKLADAIIRYNAPNGLANPDSIWPGQMLYYYLPDGSDTTIYPVFGDNQTSLVKGVIDKKGLLDPKPEPSYNGEPYSQKAIDEWSDSVGKTPLAKFWQNLKNLPVWRKLNGLSTLKKMGLLYLLLIILAGVIYTIASKRKKKAERIKAEAEAERIKAEADENLMFRVLEKVTLDHEIHSLNIKKQEKGFEFDIKYFNPKMKKNES